MDEEQTICDQCLKSGQEDDKCNSILNRLAIRIDKRRCDKVRPKKGMTVIDLTRKEMKTIATKVANEIKETKSLKETQHKFGKKAGPAAYPPKVKKLLLPLVNISAIGDKAKCPYCNGLFQVVAE